MPAAVNFVFSFYILKTICVNSMGIFFEKIMLYYNKSRKFFCFSIEITKILF